MKKLIQSLAILLMIFTLMPSSVFAETISEISDTHKFSDVNSSDVEVLYLNQIGIVKGTPSGTVVSGSALNRAETLTLLSRFFNLDPAYDPNCTFSDVPSDSWYAGYVSAMCNQGLVQGYPDGTFRPSTQLNRAEALALVVRGIGDVPSAPFNNLPSDVNNSDWYASYAEFAAMRNLFTGVSTQFDGAKFYTRGDMFEVLYRYARIKELNANVYSANLDPQIVSAIDNKNTGVTLKVGGNTDVSSYFNSIKPGKLNGTGVTPPLTYKQAASDLILYWLGAFNGQSDADFLAGTVGPLRRMAFMPDVDFTSEVKAFYEYFGVSTAGKDINANISDSEIAKIVDGIKEKANTYERMVDNLKISFLVENEKKLSIIFDDMTIGEYGWINGWDPQHEKALDGGTAGFNLEVDSLIEKGSGKEISISKSIIDTHTIKGTDSNGLEIIERMSAFADINLSEELENDKTYVLKLKPFIFRRDIRGEKNLGRFWGSTLYYTNLYLPASEFEFINNSAKEFNYVGGGNQNLAGVAIINDIRTSWNNYPLSALIYSEDGRILDVEPGELYWTVIDGGGHIVGKNGSPQLVFDEVDSKVEVIVTYKGFEDSMTIYYVSDSEI